jgi:hypothetical protein
MSRDEAIETCTKAILKRHGYGEANWKEHPKRDLATDIITALEALGLFKPV